MSAIQKYTDLAKNIEFCDDFGNEPLLLAHVTKDRSLIAVVSLLGGFIAMAGLGIPGALMVGFAALNDLYYTGKDSSNSDYTLSEIHNLSTGLDLLPKVLVESENDVFTECQTHESNFINVESVTVIPEPLIAPTALEVEPIAAKPTGFGGNVQKPSFSSQYIEPIIDSNITVESTNVTDDCNFVEYMASNLKSTLIVGIPGAGKGLTTKVLITEIRKKHPDIYIMGIDPKFAKEGKEDGYWEESRANGYDKACRFRMSDLGQEKGLNQITKFILEFKAIEGKKLLIMDEGLVVAHTIKCNKFELENFISWMVYLTSMGDSEGEYMYFLSQSGSLTELNFPSSVRNCMDVLVLAKPGNDALITGILRTDLIAKGNASSIQSLKSVMERSEVKRAFYHNIYGEWLPTKRLKNFSNYDRDTRSFIDTTVDVKVSSPIDKVTLPKSTNIGSGLTLFQRASMIADSSNDMGLSLMVWEMEDNQYEPATIKKLEAICLESTLK